MYREGRGEEGERKVEEGERRVKTRDGPRRFDFTSGVIIIHTDEHFFFYPPGVQEEEMVTNTVQT